MPIFIRLLICSLVWFAVPQAPPKTAAPGKWAADRIIDVHAHIGTFKGYDLSLPTLLENIDRYGIRLALVSNIDGAELPGTTANLDETAANQVTLETVRRYPDKLRGLLWTRPADGAPAKLEAFLRADKERLFVGLKIHPDMNNFAADDARVDGYLKLCERYNLPAVFHSGQRGTNSAPEKIYAVARRHPRVPIILYHTGFGREHEHAVAVVKESMTKGDARLYVETAQVAPEAALAAIKELGADRVLFGTDATYYGQEHYARYEALVKALHEQLLKQDFAKVMRGNAETLFKLK